MTPPSDAPFSDGDFSFDAHVSAVVEDGGEAAFALGDGRVCWAGGAAVAAHDGAVLCAAAPPAGAGVLTGGDDGRLAWSTREGTRVLFEAPRGRWIDALAVSADSGLIAVASGRQVTVLDAADGAFHRTFDHPASVAGLAFDPRGRRLAAATYGGLALWYARIAAQKPAMLRCAGSHLQVLFSPDGRFAVSAMQEPALHAWRLADGKDMAMSGYETRVRGFGFTGEGRVLATSGAPGVVLWPFTGAGGPMGKPALQIDLAFAGVTTLLAVHADGVMMAGAAEDGRIAAARAGIDGSVLVKPAPGPPISALAVLSGGAVAWGDEAGGAGVVAGW
jgi:WD40 repeat protein